MAVLIAIISLDVTYPHNSGISRSLQSELGGIVEYAAASKNVLVLILNSHGEQLQELAKTIAGGIQAEVHTCNTPLGCLDLARRYKPQNCTDSFAGSRGRECFNGRSHQGRFSSNGSENHPLTSN
jgi:hypothetical protein